MKYSSIPTARTIVQHCRTRGIKNIVISPGSRSAPLTLGFTNDPFFSCYSIVDERCAAFFALGMAQQLKECVALVCTSGSALLNYYPAVAEAFYSNIPLVVISSDRPGYKIDIGDGQTIRQDHVFDRHILYSAHLKQDVVHATEAIISAGVKLTADPEKLSEVQEGILAYNQAELVRALGQAAFEMGPVHINVPFEEPLYGMLDTVEKLPESKLEMPFPDPVPASLEAFAATWNKAVRKMVLIGSAHPGMLETEYLNVLARDPSVLVFTETTSNCHHAGFFPSIDSIIAPIEKAADRNLRFEALQPDLLLTMGGMVVSKKVKAFLRQYQPANHWHIGRKNGYDTYYSLSHHFKLHPGTFFKAFLPLTKVVQSTYNNAWTTAREQYRAKRDSYLEKVPFSDFRVFFKILQCIPPGYQLQLANSSTVRYTQLFELPRSLRVFCNRGTSGIDGSTSTAIGAALADLHPTLLITGDLSLFYDSNAFWNNYIRPDFRVIVVNNQGGGIFRILPGQEDTERFATYFETVQDLDIRHLCSLYKLEHAIASDEPEMGEALKSFFEPSERARLLEIKTPRLENNKILLEYFEYLS